MVCQTAYSPQIIVRVLILFYVSVVRRKKWKPKTKASTSNFFICTSFPSLRFRAPKRLPSCSRSVTFNSTNFSSWHPHWLRLVSSVRLLRWLHGSRNDLSIFSKGAWMPSDSMWVHGRRRLRNFHSVAKRCRCHKCHSDVWSKHRETRRTWSERLSQVPVAPARIFPSCWHHPINR